jgi:hypothetical protein
MLVRGLGRQVDAARETASIANVRASPLLKTAERRVRRRAARGIGFGGSDLRRRGERRRGDLIGALTSM